MNQRTFIATLLVLGAACTGAEPTSSVKNAISDCYEIGDPACLDDLESPDAEDVFDACFEEHAECLSTTADPEACDPLLEACFDIYDESEDVGDAIGYCYDEAEWCTRDLGVDADECLEMLGECLESIDDPATPPDAPDVALVCFEGHIACLESMGPPEECDFILEECLHAACPPDVPVDPRDPCLEAVEECIEGAPDGDAAGMCLPIADGCYDPDPGFPPCEEDYFRCLEDGAFEDPAACEALLFECEPTDPEPCFEDWEAFDWCIETGEDPDACEAYVRCDDAPPADCFVEFEFCLEVGEDPALCEEFLSECEGMPYPGDPGDPGDPAEPPHEEPPHEEPPHEEPPHEEPPHEEPPHEEPPSGEPTPTE